MESHAKIFGHPIHPMLIVFPLGLLSTATIFDVIGLFSGSGYWFLISYWLIAAGISGGLAAAIFGTVDYLAIPSGTRAKSIGLLHGAGNVVVILLFCGSWFLRPRDMVRPTFLALGCSFTAILLALVTSWLGAELLDRMGVGVDDGVHLNSPSSLSGRPASENRELRKSA